MSTSGQGKRLTTTGVKSRIEGLHAMNLIAIALIVFGCGAAAHGEDLKGDPLAGKETARKFCADCHDTTGNAKSRNPPGNAPSFRSLAQSPEQTPQQLRQYLNLPHWRMINLIVTGRDADDVISYIVSLRHQ